MNRSLWPLTVCRARSNCSCQCSCKAPQSCSWPETENIRIIYYLFFFVLVLRDGKKIHRSIVRILNPAAGMSPGKKTVFSYFVTGTEHGIIPAVVESSTEQRVARARAIYFQKKKLRAARNIMPDGKHSFWILHTF